MPDLAHRFGRCFLGQEDHGSHARGARIGRERGSVVSRRRARDPVESVATRHGNGDAVQAIFERPGGICGFDLEVGASAREGRRRTATRGVPPSPMETGSVPASSGSAERNPHIRSVPALDCVHAFRISAGEYTTNSGPTLPAERQTSQPRKSGASGYRVAQIAHSRTSGTRRRQAWVPDEKAAIASRCFCSISCFVILALYDKPHA